MRSGYAVWSIDYRLFPSGGTAAEQIRFLLSFAILAPSAHNAQPWQCEIQNGMLRIYYASARRLLISDPTHRQGLLSLGAFAANFVKAAHAYGAKADIKWLPEGNDLDKPIMEIGIDNHCINNPNAHALDLILQRRVNRSLYHRTKKIPPETINQLEQLCPFEDVQLNIINQKEQIKRVADFIEVGTRFAFKNQKFREELSRYIITASGNRSEGIPGNTSGLSDLGSLFITIWFRWVDIGKSQAYKDKKRFLSAPCILVISSLRDDYMSWVRAGYFYQLVALELTKNQIQHSISGAPIEAPMLSQKLQGLIGTNYRPQILFRIGYAEGTVPHSPRLQVSDILTL